MANTPKISEKISAMPEMAEIEEATLEELKKLRVSNDQVNSSLEGAVVSVENLLKSKEVVDMVAKLSDTEKEQLKKELNNTILFIAGGHDEREQLLRFWGDEMEALFGEEVVVDETEDVSEDTEELDITSIEYVDLKNLKDVQIKKVASSILITISLMLPEGTARNEFLKNPKGKSLSENVVKQLIEKSKKGEPEPTQEEILILVGNEAKVLGINFPIEDIKEQLQKQDEERQNRPVDPSIKETIESVSSLSPDMRKLLNYMAETETIQNEGGIGAFIASISMMSPEDAQFSLESKLTTVVSTELQNWAEGNLAVIEALNDRKERDKFNKENSQYAGKGSRIGKLIEQGSAFMNIGKGSKFKRLTDNPLLKIVFRGVPDIENRVLAILNDKEGTFKLAEHFSTEIREGVLSIVSGTSVAELAKHFRELDIPAGKATNDQQKKDTEVLLHKLRGIGEEYWGTKYEKNYQAYVEKTGPASMEFDSWIEKQEMGVIERLVFMFKRIMGSFGLFKDGEISIANMFDSTDKETESALVKDLKDKLTDELPEDTEAVDDDKKAELPDGFSEFENKIDSKITKENWAELPENLFTDESRSSFTPEVKNLFDLNMFWTPDFKLGKEEFALLGKVEKRLEGSGFSITEGDGEKYQTLEGGKLVEQETKNEGDNILSLDIEDGFWGSMNPFGDGKDASFDSIPTLFAWLKENEAKLKDD